MRCPRHDLAIAADGKCVRCRREEEEAGGSGTARGPRVVAGLLLAFVVAGALVWFIRPHAGPAPVAAAPPSATYAAPVAPPLASLDPATVAPEKSAAPSNGNAQTPLDRAMHAAVITLYSRPASADCGLARNWLLARGYTFKERDVDADLQARAAWTRTVPGDTVPAFDIDGQAFGGYDPPRIQAALEYAGAKRLQRSGSASTSSARP
jgi:hypothetical protein